MQWKTFCLLGYARVFPDEYCQVELDDVVGEFPRPRVGFRDWPLGDEQKRCMLPQLLACCLESYAKSHWMNCRLSILRISKGSCCGLTRSLVMTSCFLPTPPSPPKPKSVPFPENPQDVSPKSEKSPRTLSELKANEYLSPAFKKRKYGRQR